MVVAFGKQYYSRSTYEISFPAFYLLATLARLMIYSEGGIDKLTASNIFYMSPLPDSTTRRLSIIDPTDEISLLDFVAGADLSVLGQLAINRCSAGISERT